MAGGAARVVRRGEHDYERARSATLWNARTPPRYPDAIVRARSTDDVVEAVRMARGEGMCVGVRSGGHSWAGNHLRDGGLLLDVGGLRDVSVDAPAARAAIGPGCAGSALLDELAPLELFFPVGHCVGVALGGYLLQGGFGWNGRVLGPACMSVEAIDVVTAEGELLRADRDHHAELYWAARGAGPGFFGVVTCFHLRLHARPTTIANAIYAFPLPALEDLFAWAVEIGSRVPGNVELMLLAHRDDGGEPEIALTAPVLADSEEEARAALSFLDSCPVLGAAKLAVPYVPVGFEDLFAGSMAIYPEDHRWATDNMWTHAPAEDLLPGLRRIAETLPQSPSHMLWLNWGPCEARPDMAFSVEDRFYIALYGGCEAAAGDEATAAWATERMREMEPLASGIQLADENLGRRPARFVSDENLRRLDAVRAAYDPDGLFHPWMGRQWEPDRSGASERGR